MARAPLALLVMGLLAGCFGPQAEEPESVFGACPHWIARSAPEEATIVLTAGTNQSHDMVPRDAHGEPVLEKDGYPFDMVQLELLRFDSDNGTLVLQAEAPDRGERGALRIHDYGQAREARSVPEVRLPPDAQPEGELFEVYRSAVDHGATVEPGPIRLTWFAVGGDVELRLRLSYWDRVCGVP